MERLHSHALASVMPQWPSWLLKLDPGMNILRLWSKIAYAYVRTFRSRKNIWQEAIESDFQCWFYSIMKGNQETNLIFPSLSLQSSNKDNYGSFSCLIGVMEEPNETTWMCFVALASWNIEQCGFSSFIPFQICYPLHSFHNFIVSAG